MSDFGEKFDRERGKFSFRYKRTPKRILVKEEGRVSPEAEKGRVIASMGRYFIVESEVSTEQNGRYLECEVAGALITKNEAKTLVCVGDNVWFERDSVLNDEGTPTGFIVKVEDRYSVLARKEVGNPNEDIIAGNVDKLMVFMSAWEPPYNKRLIDRYLVSAELNGLEPSICINKTDLAKKKEIKEDLAIYYEMGIRIFLISAKKKQGIKDVVEYIGETNLVLSGPSGSGKSTLINAIFGEKVQEVNEISEKTNKGKHTTTFARLFALTSGGSVIDTPGIREFALWGLDKEELPLYFHDFDPFATECRYLPCTHTHEPYCAVKQAYEDGMIDSERYESYLNIYDSLEEEENKQKP